MKDRSFLSFTSEIGRSLIPSVCCNGRHDDAAGAPAHENLKLFEAPVSCYALNVLQLAI